MTAQPAPRSLRTRLLALLLLAIAGVALVQVALGYRTALAEADALFDYQMQQMAQVLRPGLPSLPPGEYGPLVQGQESREFVVQVWSADGLRVYESNFGLALPQRAVLGFSNVRVGATTYRVLSVQTPLQVIQVAQDLDVRRAMARQLALRTALPTVLLAPLLGFVAWRGVGGVLAPVERVRRQVAQRRADALAPLDGAGLPSEVRPLVDEFNALLARVGQAFEAQQHFVADAAHELRSPLAALKLQVQALSRAQDDAARQRAGERLGAGIDRATRLVEQLLALARQEAQIAQGEPAEPLVLADLVRQCVADAVHAAQLRSIDLGLAQLAGDAAQARVAGHVQALAILLRNLLDNAIKYTPEGGRIDVQLRAEGAQLLLTVDDSGPGIAPAQRERVLRRFHRAAGAQGAEGSGLGLAIAETIARLHGSALVLGDAPQLGGLRVQLALARLSDGMDGTDEGGA